MPISTIMLLTVGSAWTRCDSGAVMPIVAATLVAASSTGMPAAISAPNASSIRTSVTGRLMPSAEERSSATRSLMPASIERSPASRTWRSGWSRLDALGDVLERRGVLVVLGELDRDQQRRPVRVRLRLRDLLHARRRRGHPRAQLGRGRARGLTESSAASPRGVIRTFSVVGDSSPASCTMASARPDSPSR